MDRFAGLSVRELKKLLSDRGIACSSFLERSEFIRALLDSEKAERMTVSEMKDLIRHLAGRTTGMFERGDLWRRLQELLGDKQCVVCLDQLIVPERAMTYLSCCPDVYHLDCLQQYVLKTVEEGKFPVSCMKCGREVEIGKVFKQDTALCTKYHTISSKLIEQRNNTVDNQELRGMGFTQCPKCKVWIEKGPAYEAFGMEIPGCNKMTCRCGHQFCFKCAADKGRCACTGDQHDFFPHEEVIQDYPSARGPTNRWF